MKKSFLLVVAAAGMFVACNNADMDSRLALLEQRVTALEDGKTLADAPHDDHAGHANEVLNAQPVVDDAAVDGPAAAFAFEKMEYDFGTVKDGAIVEHTFKFKNTGEVPLVIKSATATCGCTVPKKPEHPIAPGETGEIQVRFDSSNKPGAQNKTVTVTANTNPAITRLVIKGNVEPKAASAPLGAAGPLKQ